MSTHTRYGFKWTVNEVLSLQREFELLGWSIDQIAQKHKRSSNAIMYKLHEEGLADYNVLYSNYNALHTPEEASHTDIWLKHDIDEEYIQNDDCDDNEVADLSERVHGLEDSVSEIRDMLKKIMLTFNKTSTSKRLL